MMICLVKVLLLVGLKKLTVEGINIIRFRQQCIEIADQSPIISIKLANYVNVL